MKMTKPLVAVVLLASLFTACKQTDFKKTKEGFTYKVYSDGKGEKIVAGDYVGMYRTIKIKDSILQSSYGTAPQIVPIPKDSSIKDNELLQILLTARKGDSVQINQPVDSILRQNPQAAQDPLLLRNKGQNIVYIYKIAEVYKNQDQAMAAMEKQDMEAFNQQPGVGVQRKNDEAAIDAYLKANNIQATKTPWGSYIQVVQPGNGQKAKYGEFMMLRYTGKDLEGHVFDTNNKPGGQLMPFQVGAGGTIPGFADAVKQLTKGEKANIYVPSVLGYGERGTPPNPQTKEQAIKPNQNLVFEVEVVDITDKVPGQTLPQTHDSTSR